MTGFDKRYDKWKAMVETRLQSYLPLPEEGIARIKVYEAMRHSLFAGGKRLRPVLSLAACGAAGTSEEAALPYACAIEMIHTYSLIHDDLPAMDNDDYRRGKPSCHKAFGEATAILAGDGLLNRAYEIMLEDISGNSKDMSADILINKAKAAALIAAASGAEGMVGGQMEDILFEKSTIPDIRTVTPQMLKDMHIKKTVMLIRAALLLPSVLSGNANGNMEIIALYADSLGLAFQIRDDILDLAGDPSELGKSTGKDNITGKATYVTIYGIEKAGEMLAAVTEDAVSAAGRLGAAGLFLADLAHRMSVRKS